MTDIATITDQDNFSEQFAKFSKGAPAGPDWLAVRRRAAMRTFDDLGLPSRSDEEWRFTNPARIAETPFRVTNAKYDTQWLADNADTFRGLIAQYLMGESNPVGLALLNGRSVAVGSGLAASADDPCILPMAHLLHRSAHAKYETSVSHYLNSHFSFQSHALTALNTAFSSKMAPSSSSLPTLLSSDQSRSFTSLFPVMATKLL